MCFTRPTLAGLLDALLVGYCCCQGTEPFLFEIHMYIKATQAHSQGVGKARDITSPISQPCMKWGEAKAVTWGGSHLTSSRVCHLLQPLVGKAFWPVRLSGQIYNTAQLSLDSITASCQTWYILSKVTSPFP